MSKPYLEVTKDFTKDFMQLVNQFKNNVVLVGVPEEASTREPDPKVKQEIGNAALAAIQNFGSPANNIPARPFMQIGIRNAKDEVAEQFKKAAKAALKNGPAALDLYYEKAGMIAASAIKKAIVDQEGFEPLAPSTLRAREARGFKGTKALIVTGQLRNSITYVVNKGGQK